MQEFSNVERNRPFEPLPKQYGIELLNVSFASAFEISHQLGAQVF